MTRARWATAALVFALLWLGSAALLAPRLQAQLQAAAQRTLAQLAPTVPAHSLDHLQVTFTGQQAQLSGHVRHPEEHHAVLKALRENVHLAPLPLGIGAGLNPISQVQDAVEVRPLSPGWLILASTGSQARLLGTVASEYEARDLTRSLQDTWGLQGGRIDGQLRVDTTTHDESATPRASLTGVPSPLAEAALHVATIGTSWQTLPLEMPDEALRARLTSSGVTEQEWQRQVLPALQDARARHQEQTRAAAERRRIAALPPSHLFIATRGQEVTLRGQVADEATKRELLDEALAAFAPLRIHDEVDVNARCRPGNDFAPLTKALLPPAADPQGKSLYLGVDDEAWKAVDWQVAADAQPWKDDVPPALPRDWVQEDSTSVIEWLQGAAKPEPDRRILPSFISLALFGDRAILSGQVAEESARSQMVAAVRQTYGPNIGVSHENLRVNADCRPFPGILNVLKSLPSAPQAGHRPPARFAVATAAGWLILPVTPDLLEAGGLTRTGLFSEELPALLVEERSQEALEQLRLWHSRLVDSLSASR